jgi:hypothetical protein
LDAGRILTPARTTADMHTVVTNSTVSDVLIALFLLLVAVVTSNAAVVCVRAIRSATPLPTTEAPYVESRSTQPGQAAEPLGRSPLTRIRRRVRAVRWCLREPTRRAQYDRHCERHRRHHPLAPVPTRREYRALRTRHKEARTHSRCC